MLIHLNIIHRPKHQTNIQFLYRLCILGNLHKIHCPEPRQQILALYLLLPLRQQHLPALQQPIPRHQVNLDQRILINMSVPTSQYPFHLIPLTTLPHLPVSAWCPPPLSGKSLFTFSTNNLTGKWIHFRVLGKPCNIMFLQIPFSPLHLQLHTFPNPRLYNGFMVILNIILLNLPLILHPLFRQEVRGIALLQKCVSLELFISLCQDIQQKIWLLIKHTFMQTFTLKIAIPGEYKVFLIMDEF